MERQDLVRWLADYKRSWEELDTELLVSLFTADASYYPTPFWIPFKGSGDLRKLWDNLKGHQAENHIDLVLLALDGDKAVVRWQGYRRRSAAPASGAATESSCSPSTRRGNAANCWNGSTGIPTTSRSLATRRRSR